MDCWMSAVGVLWGCGTGTEIPWSAAGFLGMYRIEVIWSAPGVLRMYRIQATWSAAGVLRMCEMEGTRDKLWCIVSAL
ncbi:hypothetical protein FGB62_16g37 [Gracilaria domingensis]|nr:hypothetical protein FGB62_16g37 [Gracilaria domingensis]